MCGGSFSAEPEDTRTEHVLLQLCRADFHGAQLRVLRAHCHSLQGAAGIVLLESRGTFQIVTPQNKVKSECYLTGLCRSSMSRSPSRVRELPLVYSVFDTVFHTHNFYFLGVGAIIP